MTFTERLIYVKHVKHSDYEKNQNDRKIGGRNDKTQT